MKRTLSSLAALFFLGTLIACGGSGANPSNIIGAGGIPPAAANAGFSNASLTGNYVFSARGFDASGALFAVVGVFAADGNGNVTSGQEDANDADTGPLQTALTAGSYSVATDGRGSVTLNSANGGSVIFQFVLSSTSRGRLIEMSNVENASGLMELQTPAAIASLTGTYIIRMDDFDSQGGFPLSRVGMLTAAGAATGTISTMFDENFEGTFTPQIPSTVGTFTLGAAGRGVISIQTSAGAGGSGGASSFVFYIVNASRFEFIESDTNFRLSGYADAQSGAFTTASVNGSYAYQTTGLTPGPFVIDEAGAFTLNGSGNISNGLEDFTNGGAYSPAVAFSGSYSVGSDGRATGQTISSNRTVDFVLWFSSPQAAIMMTTDSTLVESGPVTVQPAAPANGTLNANYALHLSGFSSNDTLLTDIVGQLQANGQGTFTGLEDFNQGGILKTGTSADGSFSFANGRGTGSIGGIPAVLYPADSNTVYVITADGNRQMLGTLEAQP